jgi:hypothetical protein
MANINFANREVNCKIVYYGPGRSGKTTNLDLVHQRAPKDSIGEMVSIATETDRTLFFDFLPLDLGQVAGMNTKFQLYTVPGQVYYNATRKLVLQGADGVVFVADSQRSMHDENIESLQNLEENLRENGLNIDDMPLVIQYNKRDLDDIESVDEMEAYLNRWNAPHFEAVAVEGDGVFATLKAVASRVIHKLNEESRLMEAPASTSAGQSAAAPAPKPAAPKAQPAAAPQSPPPAEAPPEPAAGASTTPPSVGPPPASAPPAEAPQTVGPPPASEEAGFMGSPPAEEQTPAQPAQPPGAVGPPPASAGPPPSGPARPSQPEPAAATDEAESVDELEEVSEEPPAAAAQPAPAAASEADNPLKRELERKRAERAQMEQQMRERIQRSARRPVKPSRDKKTILLAAALGAVIVVAALVGAYLVMRP